MDNKITLTLEEYNALVSNETQPVNDKEYLALYNRAKGVIRSLPSNCFFTNRKTIVSCDFGICALMTRTSEGNLTSNTCRGCYAANILNIYKGTQEKLVAMTGKETTPEDLEDFEVSCHKIRRYLPEITRLRFYSLSDFSPANMPFIKIASKYFTVDIISKTLTLPNNEQYLMELFNMENVWVSLSFSKDFKKTLPRIKALLAEHEPSNVNMNYLMNYFEENPEDPEFDCFNLFHFRNNDKRAATEKFDTITEERVCAVFSGGGNRVKAHGSCHSCNNCHLSTADFLKGKKPDLPTQIRKGSEMSKKRTRRIIKKG